MCYGYDMIKSDVVRTEFTANWERFPLLINHISDYDYVMWVDCDAIFLKNCPPITNLINKYPDKLFIFSADVDSRCDSDLNSGVIIVKSSPQSAKLLKEMYTNPILTRYANGYQGYFDNWDYPGYNQDQGAIRFMLSQNHCSLKEVSVVVPYGVLQLFPGHKVPSHNVERSTLRPHTGDENIPYIYHFAGSPHKKRVIYARLYVKANFPTICKCGCEKYAKMAACCVLCSRNVGHGPLCFTHGSKTNPDWINLHSKYRSL
jgi:hypothetical protein